MGRKRRPGAATLTALLGALSVFAPGGSASVGPRVTVAVYGDSIVEAYTIPGYLQNGLVPALGTGLVRSGGFSRGGAGLVPVTPFRMRFNHYTVLGGTPPSPNGWVLAGYASHGEDGPSGYSGLAYSPAATASAPVDSPDVAVL
ncbi:MAG: hypothetical protein LC713_03005, partial [Actinobacteria bacterium]|nr:hypothetical protein [Actinomycetota bacterium]